MGRVRTVGRGISPESDIAVFNMLGYSFSRGYPGRGVIEAVGAGLDFRDGALALRANFATVVSGLITDRRAGRDLTKEEGAKLAQEIRKIKLPDTEVEFKHTVSHRAVLVFRSRTPLSAEISNTDPAYERVKGFGAAKKIGPNESILTSHPISRSKGARLAARLVNEFTERALKVLLESRVNKARVRDGKKPANAVLLRDAGDHLPKVKSFKEQYGMEGIAIVEMPAEVGIARILRMKEIVLKDPNDLPGKAKTFLRSIKDGTVVYAHIKGPDEFGHDGDAVGKKKSIERIDREFFSEVRGLLRAARIVVSCDHATPCALKMHSSDRVPLLISSKGKDRDCCRFTERDSKHGSLGSMMGAEVLKKALAG
jgi:2,3-bisphosphoglycerate-independent phosphoglycerate mutase